MSPGYGNNDRNDDNSHDEDVGSTDFTMTNFIFVKWRPRAEEREQSADGRGKPRP